jgi:hypothetical protein
MPIGSISVAEAGEIVSTTLRSRTGELVDNTSKNNPVLRRLKAKGKIKPWRGGRFIMQEIHYSGNTTYRRYRGYDPLNITPSETIGSYDYDPKYVAVAVTISGDELLMNYGQAQVIDLMESRIENAMAEMSNGLDVDLVSDGTADGGKQIGGLQLLVSSSPSTGTVGGASRVTYSFARNQRFQAATDGGAVASSANITNYLDRLWLQCLRGADSPDVILMDNNYFFFYESSVQALQRITSTGTGPSGQGFTGYKYKGADVVPNGQGGNIPANTAYMLNTNYIFLRPHADRNMDVVGGDRIPVNQDATVNIIGFAGNLTCSNFQLQGVLVNS